MSIIYTNEEINLAKEITHTLQDWEAQSTHLAFARRFSEWYLRKQLAKVMATREDEITNSRGAYFTYLVNKYKDDDGARR